MKKLISIIVLICVILVANIALAASVKVNVSASARVEEGTKTVVMTLSLGQFQEVEEGQVLGFQSTLEYSKDIFESVTVEGLNGWDVTYEDSSNVVVGKTTSSKANVDIAKFTFTIKDGVSAGSTDNILLNEFLLTNDDTLNQEGNYSVEVSIVEKPSTDDTDSEKPGNTTVGNNTVVENSTDNNTASDIQNNKVTNNTAIDNTVKNTNKLPAAGIKSTIIIGALIILIVGVGFMIRSKSIKLK